MGYMPETYLRLRSLCQPGLVATSVLNHVGSVLPLPLLSTEDGVR